jgi:succinate-acetate transporter protein
MPVGFAVAQDSAFKPLMEPGDFAVTAVIGYGFFWSLISILLKLDTSWFSAEAPE